MSSCGKICRFPCLLAGSGTSSFWSIDHCSLCWVCCWARCWILQDMDDTEACCVIDVKAGMPDRLESSKISILTVTKMGIVMLTVQHDLIVSVSFMEYPRDFLGQTLPDIRSLDEFPLYISQSWCFGCRTPLFTSVNNQTISDWLTANRRTLGHPWKLQPYAAGFILSKTCKLAVTYSILTWSWPYIPQDLPLLFVIIFLSYSTPANNAYTNTPASWERIRIKPIDGRFIPCVTCWFTATTQATVSPPQRWQCSHRRYDPVCAFKHCQSDGKRQEYEAACNWMGVYPYRGKRGSTNSLVHSGYM